MAITLYFSVKDGYIIVQARLRHQRITMDVRAALLQMIKNKIKMKKKKINGK